MPRRPTETKALTPTLDALLEAARALPDSPARRWLLRLAAGERWSSLAGGEGASGGGRKESGQSPRSASRRGKR